MINVTWGCYLPWPLRIWKRLWLFFTEWTLIRVGFPVHGIKTPNMRDFVLFFLIIRIQNLYKSIFTLDLADGTMLECITIILIIQASLRTFNNCIIGTEDALRSRWAMMTIHSTPSIPNKPGNELREVCGKSKWKFKMAFAMKGVGSRGGLECHIPILKNDFC